MLFYRFYWCNGFASLLLKSIPAFERTWIECLGGLARYRRALEEVDMGAAVDD